MPIDNSTRFPKPLAADLRELSEGMAIVIDGDTAPKAITSGQYLFIKNHSTLATGGYHATAAIASGADITSSNVTPDADGIVNGAFSSLSEQIANKQNKIITTSNSFTISDTTFGYIDSGISSTNYVILKAQVNNVSNFTVDITNIQNGNYRFQLRETTDQSIKKSGTYTIWYAYIGWN